MKRTTIGITVLTLALTGCMGGEDTQEQELEAEAEAQAASSNSGIQFSYPIQGQSGFPASAPMIVQFGMPVTTSENELGASNIGLDRQTGDGFEPLAPERVDAIVDDVRIGPDGETLRINTAQDLEPGARYRLTVTGVSVDDGLADTPPIEFTTASNRNTGTVNQRLDAEAEGIDDFSVARLVPFSSEVEGSALGEGSSNFPFTNFNTLRVQFTQPVDESSVTYGENGSVRLQDSGGNLVPEAEVWVRGNRMVIDPEGVLKAGDTYELNFTEELTSSLTGTTITGDTSWTFTPQEARIVTEDGLVERDVLAQEAVMGSNESMDYTGEDYNSVVLGATTLGQGNKTVQRGTVNAYMGHTKRFEREDKAIPLTVKQGTLMKGTSVDVLVGGALQTEFEESGEIDVRFLSDANGYMMMNPYSDSPSAPRVVRLFADLAMNTEKPRANGALAQELLHVELVGTATVEDDKLTLKAVSVIEPDVLGIDKASGLISFRLEAFNDPEEAPEPITDNSGPQLKAWTPGNDETLKLSGEPYQDHQDKMQPQDPITLFFDEPLLPSSVNEENVTLSDGDAQVPASVRLNGSNIIVDPHDSLDYGKEYTLTVSGVTDLKGAPLEQGTLGLGFSLPKSSAGVPLLSITPLDDRTGETNVGPLVLTSRPGYPCAKMDLDTPKSGQLPQTNGRCLGGITDPPAENRQEIGDMFFDGSSDGQTSFFEGVEGTHLFTPDDILPIETLKADSPIVVRFSQDMKLESINKDTFIVEKWEGEKSEPWQKVSDIQLQKSSREVHALPEDGWDPASVYRYRMITETHPSSATSSIQSVHGIPLYTKILQQYRRDGRPFTDLQTGGDSDQAYDLVNRFQVSEGNDGHVLTPLSNLSTPDANSNLMLDGEESSALSGLGTVGGSESIKQVLDAADVPANSAAMEITDVSSEVLADGGAAIGCEPGVDCDIRNRMIFKTAKLDVDTLPGTTTWEDEGITGVPVKLHPSVLYTTSSDVAIELESEFISLLATGDVETNVSIPTGPMVMRMRYQGEDNSQLIDGVIYEDEGLRFRTELDVYLDAPFLLSKLSSSLSNTILEDNMKSFRINGLELDGPITFFEDGRMQIEQRNMKAIELDVKLRGAINTSITDDTCPDWDLLCQILSGGANALINPNTDMTMKIPANRLYLNYITPYTQQRE